MVTSNIKAGSKLGHHVCTTCGRPFSRSYSARRHLRDQHQGYGQITSLTEYIFGLSQGRYLMPTYTLPKAQRSAATRKWSSNYRGGAPSSFDAYIKTFTDFYTNDPIRLGYNIIGMNQMSNPRANPPSNYYYYGYPTLQWTTNSTWAMPRAGIQAPSPPLQGYYYPSWTPAYSGHQKAQKKPERDTHDNGAASAVVAAASGPRDPKPQGSRSMLLPTFGGIFTLDRHEEAVGEGGSGGIAVHWVLAFAFHKDQKMSFINFWRFDRDPTSLLLASDEDDDDDDTTHQDDGAENRQTLEARVILQVKPRKWQRRRFFANERSVRTHRCCSSCKETSLDNGIFRVVSVSAGMIAYKLQGQKYYAAKCEFRANSGDSELYQVTARVS